MATILIVDDSSYARRVLRKTLEMGEHTVIEASSGMSALESFVMHSPEVVLLDLTMEDIGGLDVLGRLREIDSTVPVIVVSADIQRSTAKAVADAGAVRFLAKPAEPDDILNAVRSALNGARE